MSAPAVISGDFATYKHVQGRKMLQLVIEVPAEMASAVFAALGMLEFVATTIAIGWLAVYGSVLAFRGATSPVVAVLARDDVEQPVG